MFSGSAISLVCCPVVRRHPEREPVLAPLRPSPRGGLAPLRYMPSQQRSRALRLVLVGIWLAAILGFGTPVFGESAGEVFGDRITISVAGSDLRLPCRANHPLDQPNAAIERLVIAIHGSNTGLRDAPPTYVRLLDAARSITGAESKTLILVPQFLTPGDISAYNLGADVLRWSSGGWTWGDESLVASGYTRTTHISSFAILDQILERLTSRTLFPNLTSVVIAGLSSGGQFVQRFAAGSRTEETLLAPLGIHVRYIVAAPASFLYFDGARRVKGTLDQFAPPPASDLSSCAYTYDDYGYGLQHLSPYMAAVGVEQIRAQYPQREVIYLIGSLDNDPNNTGMTTCQVMLQGSQRLERATIFYNYIQHYFGSTIRSKHTLVVVRGVGHSLLLFTSFCGIRYLFDYDPWRLCWTQ